MVIFIDGARNSGKTHLISNINSDVDKYKFPFNEHYENLKLSNDKSLFLLNLGYNLTLLDLIKNKTVVDRGILSDVVFGIMSNRITFEEGEYFLNYISNKFDFKIVYIIADNRVDNRDKDKWVYDKYLYDEYSLKLIEKLKNVTIFKNEFNKDSVFKFNIIINAL